MNVDNDKSPLSEKEFIQNGWKFTSLPFWLSLFLVILAISLIWWTIGWYKSLIEKEKKHDRFLEVTHREFSVFLWQFPSFLKNDIPEKNDYLQGSLSTLENFDPITAEEWVSAPTDLIFLYHTWHRLLAPDVILRPINAKEFEEFLEELTEWQPKNWPNAPKKYIQLINSKSYTNIDNLQTLPENVLPLIVRQVFQGWKNYFKEDKKIDELNPTFAEVQAFLELHPHYARPFWRNIDEIDDQQVAGADYLLALLNGNIVPNARFPKDQLPLFLKMALFNASEAQQSR